MRAIVQRVADARVIVAGDVVGTIGRGLLVYLGVGADDSERDRAWLLSKVLGLRIFENDEGKISLDVRQVAGSLLVVSQFTLYGDLTKGLRPSFSEAMAPAGAEAHYQRFLEEARAHVPTEAGVFGAHMQVISTNDGPFTIWIDSRKSVTIVP